MGKFSFGKVLLGVTCGVTIPFCVHDNVYYAIATCFLSPHLKYSRETRQRNQDKAIPVEALDSYIADVGKSFLFFWLIIGPTVYKTYWLGEDMLAMGQEVGLNGNHEATAKQDTFTDILKKMKSAEKKKSDAVKAEGGIEGKAQDEQGGRITFEDYEKLMHKLEREQNWRQIQEQNPKAKEYLRRYQEE
mmetsp:Transcript_11504/g.14475  ORF Transcript_11504/g.14475 Transcript_11504/m.14475 type:complete len:189 (+) Transcript_11504:20-586(+)|eukprot:CAMPEP_0170476362 /NCGR_PEP_ID=MMETSP0123-20130129/17788_1 /TAXON_ID=182087 /ORGANISM="Favella ehrenbergii, Strain Fehren 1" /LENGTH=188 /DNA_ID=CAMNT_0010747347 /DNA_START=3 /DNA_END=569 /DNA_ORIENTATION=-